MAAINDQLPIENDYYHLDIFLYSTYKNLGQYDIIKNNEIIGDLTTFDLIGQGSLEPTPTNDIGSVTITGLTNSRLDKVITYSGEYKVGINGVIVVSDEYIMYEIDGIGYTTFLEDNLTIYSLVKPTNEFEPQNIIRDDNSSSIDIKKTLNAFVIDRSNISIYEYFNKINNCDNLDDLLDIF